MSLDVYLEVSEPVARERSGIFIRRNGATVEIAREEWDEINPGVEPVVSAAEADSCTVFDANITHNLTEMADKAGLYKFLWCPDEVGISRASELIGPLSVGLEMLKEQPDYFRSFNPPNGWGDYDWLVKFTADYLEACREYPQATVRVWR